MSKLYSWQVGDRIYTKQGRRPYRKNITAFLERALPLIAAENYTAIVTGRVLYDIKNTKDFDMWLQGPITDYKKLEQLLLNLFDIAYNHAELIIDVKWSSTKSGIIMDPEHGIINRNAEHISLSYSELINPVGNSWIIDRRNHPNYTPVSDWLVRSNFNSLPNKFKPHQIEYVKRHGGIKTVPVEEFVKNLDQYLTPLEKSLPKYNFSPSTEYLQPDNKNLYNIFSEEIGIDYTQAKVLDFGCNQGNYVRRAYKTVKPSQYVGIDVNFFSIEAAKIKHPAYKFIHYNKWHPSYNPFGDKNVNLTDFVDTDFDVVVAYSVLTHTTINQTKKILDELYQVIKPGGTLLFTIWLAEQFPNFCNFIKHTQTNMSFDNNCHEPDFNSVMYWIDYTTIATDVDDLDIDVCGNLCVFYQKHSFEKLFPEAKFVKKVTDGGTQWLYRIDKPA
jgi:SAM-dependent methyltransferase